MADEKAESPPDAVLRGEIRRMLERRIDELPVAFRTVFVMREVEDMTRAGDCRVPVHPAATVRTRLFRARALLREALARDLDMATATCSASPASAATASWPACWRALRPPRRPDPPAPREPLPAPASNR